MKKVISILTIAALIALAVSGCAQGLPSPSDNKSPAPSATMPQETADAPIPSATADSVGKKDSPDASLSPLALKLNAETAIDINNDGQDEIVKISFADPTPQSAGLCTLNIRAADGKEYTATMEGQMFEKAIVAKLGAASDPLEILVCIDYASCDYETSIYRFNGEKIVKIDYIYGVPASVEGGVLTIHNSLDCLGTWTGSMKYVLSSAGTLAPVVGELWQTTCDLDPLTVMKELPVEILDNGEYISGVLETGGQISVIATDLESYVYFKTPKGALGRIKFTKGEYGLLKIDGVDEYEWFEELNYSGGG